MSDDTTITVQTMSNGGTVEVQLEGMSKYILGIYDKIGDPVRDVLLTEVEVDELVLKLQFALDKARHQATKKIPRVKKRKEKPAKAG